MIQKRKLPNGLTVITVPEHDTAAVTVMLLVPVGSRYEVPTTNGISHFLEHLMFKGTTKRPSTLDISKALDGVGAEYNAYTSKDHTLYFIKVAAQHLDLALDLFADMLFNSLFDPKEIERERGVVLEEINMYEDNPLMHLDTVLEMCVFGKHHPLGYDIAGPKKNIRNIPRQSFINYRTNHYVPANMHLVIAGKTNSAVQRLVKKYFGQQRGGKPQVKPKPFKATQQKPQSMHNIKKTQQTQLGLGFVAFPYNHPLLPAASVLSTILGGNMSSRLFINIRERQGLCYFIRSEVSPYTDSGIFSIQAGLDNTRIVPAIAAILGELRRFKHELVSSEELAMAKEYIKGQMALKLEDSSAVASWYGRQSVLTGKLISPTLRIKTLETVTAEQVRQVAKQLFTTSHLNIASIGPQPIKLSSLKSTLVL